MNTSKNAHHHTRILAPEVALGLIRQVGFQISASLKNGRSLSLPVSKAVWVACSFFVMTSVSAQELGLQLSRTLSKKAPIQSNQPAMLQTNDDFEPPQLAASNQRYSTASVSSPVQGLALIPQGVSYALSNHFDLHYVGSSTAFGATSSWQQLRVVNKDKKYSQWFFSLGQRQSNSSKEESVTAGVGILLPLK